VCKVKHKYITMVVEKWNEEVVKKGIFGHQSSKEGVNP
jgi:hypothetical protein